MVENKNFELYLNNTEKKIIKKIYEFGGVASLEELIGGNEISKGEIVTTVSILKKKKIISIEEIVKKNICLNLEKVNKNIPLLERKILNIFDGRKKINVEEIEKILNCDEKNIGLGWSLKKKLIVFSNNEKNVIELTKYGEKMLGEKMEDEKVIDKLLKEDLLEEEVEENILKDLEKRSDFILKKIFKNYIFKLINNFGEIIEEGRLNLKEEVSQLTPEMLNEKKWKNVIFRKYDINTSSIPCNLIKKHPLSILKEDVKNIFISMGFEEIEDDFVQPSFWNMDALFTPQNHPVRDMHDTFYLKNPEYIEIEEKDIVKKIKKIHKSGGKTGSTGWGGEWKLKIAEKAILRTHLTVNSVKYLSKKNKLPIKTFSVSKIFRKDSIDKTHLPEFNQIEGLFVDKSSSVSKLIEIIKKFYFLLGFEKIRIRPAYFPYTEPSIEIDVFFNEEWLELGGGGVLRPEVVSPYNIKVPVLAWGLGFERLAMIKYNVEDIRYFYSNDLSFLKKCKAYI